MKQIYFLLHRCRVNLLVKNNINANYRCHTPQYSRLFYL